MDFEYTFRVDDHDRGLDCGSKKLSGILGFVERHRSLFELLENRVDHLVVPTIQADNVSSIRTLVQYIVSMYKIAYKVYRRLLDGKVSHPSEILKVHVDWPLL